MLACILKLWAQPAGFSADWCGVECSRGGSFAVKGSGNRRDGKEVPALLAAGASPDLGSTSVIEMVLDRRPGPHGGRALVGFGDAGPDAGSRGRDRQAALRGHLHRGESGVRREAEGRGTVARGLLRERRSHGRPKAAGGAAAGGGAGPGGVSGGRAGPARVEVG